MGKFRSYLELLGNRLEDENSNGFIAAIDADKNLIFLHKIDGENVGLELDDNGVAHFAHNLFDNGDIRLMPEHTTIYAYNESTKEFAIKAYDMDSYSSFYIDKNRNMFLIKNTKELKIAKLNFNSILEWTKSFPVVNMNYEQIQDFYTDSDNNIYLTVNPDFEAAIEINGITVSNCTLKMNASGDIQIIAKGYTPLFSLVNSNGELNTYHDGKYGYYGNSGYSNIKALIKQ